MAGEKLKDLLGMLQNPHETTVNEVNDSPGEYGQSTWVFGRGEDCDFVYSLPKVSRRHFKIDYIDSHYYITDLNSTNGTFLNGKKLSHMERLFAGDIISMGGCDIVFTKSLLKAKTPMI